MDSKIPYKIYLDENEMPKQWYNVRADMKIKPAPLLNPATMKPMTLEELSGVFCTELAKQELDNDTAYFDIPDEICDFYKMYRPSPLVRAYFLEKALGTPAKIYYKFEGNNTSGSHKLNSAIAQAYYAKQQGLKGVTTETGAGQWGTALSMACSYFDLDCKVFMVKVSYEQKPFRREVMRTYGASVTPSPSETTNVGKKILQQHPGTSGSLGCAISEAVETAVSSEGYRYVLGSVLSQVLLHQSIIGLESMAACDKYDIKPDIIIGCAGGGSNLGGLISPFMGRKLRGEADYKFIAVEPASCPSMTRGTYAYDFCGGSARSKSSGKSTDMTIFTEKEDLLTVFNYIQGLENVNPEQMFLFGGSQGGFVTSLVAEELKEKTKGMILYFPALNIPDDWRRNYPETDKIPEVTDFWGLQLGKEFFLSIHDFYTFDNIGSYPNDVLIIYGDKDNIVPYDAMLKAEKAYNSAELVVLENEGHGFSSTGGKKAMEMVLDFMKKH